MNLVAAILTTIVIPTFVPAESISVVEERVTLKCFVDIVAKSTDQKIELDCESLKKVGITTNHIFTKVNEKGTTKELLLWAVKEVSKTNKNITLTERNGSFVIEGTFQ